MNTLFRIEVPLGSLWTGASAHPKAQEEWVDLPLPPAEVFASAFDQGITAGQISWWFTSSGWAVFGEPLADWFQADGDSYRVLEMVSCNEIIYQDEWQVAAINAKYCVGPMDDGISFNLHYSED